MTLPKLPTSSSQISEGPGLAKLRKNANLLATSDWLLQESRSRFSQSSMSPSSSGASVEISFPKMSTESFNSNYSEV